MLRRNKFWRVLAAILAWCGLSMATTTTGFGQESWKEDLKNIGKQLKGAAPFSMTTSAENVQVSTLLSVDKVHPGAQFQVAVVLDIEENWHINAHVPTNEYLIGTELNLDIPEGIEVLDTRYPEAKRFKFSFAKDTLDVYTGRAPIFVTLKVSENFSHGQYILKGNLWVQACDDQTCLAPSNIDVRVPLKVVGFDQPIVLNKNDLFSSINPSNTPAFDNKIDQLFSSRGVFLAFIGIFVIGLALNLTPCVYPMLTVTVSLFGIQRDPKAVRVFLKALVYVLGIATMYTLLGVMAALTGGMFGAMLQNSWVLVGIAILLFALALSMFGLYELRPPYWLTSRLGRTTTVGTIGIYLSGLVVGVFAAPCIGPPIIALLALVGAKGDSLFAFWAFFVLSLGLGVPYLILGTFSGPPPVLSRNRRSISLVNLLASLRWMGLKVDS